MGGIDDSICAKGVGDRREADADIDGELPPAQWHNLHKRLASVVVPGDRDLAHALGAERF